MIDGHTKLYGLLAHPAAHSLSPLIHNNSFQINNINSVYLAFDVTSKNLQKAVDAIRAMELGGVNLSMPLKTDVIPMLDEVTPRAKRLNAVNTIVNHDGHLTGDSTDGDGFINSLKNDGIFVKNQNITIFGAGGAGRAIISACIDAAAKKITVFKRNNDSFESRKAQLESWSDKVSVVPYDNEKLMVDSVDSSSIIANTTNVGMAGEQKKPVSDEIISHFNSNKTVVDVIYFPLETPFLKAAAKTGARTYNGLGMLVYQAASSFNEWTNTDMPVQKIISIVKKNV